MNWSEVISKFYALPDGDLAPRRIDMPVPFEFARVVVPAEGRLAASSDLEETVDRADHGLAELRRQRPLAGHALHPVGARAELQVDRRLARKHIGWTVQSLPGGPAFRRCLAPRGDPRPPRRSQSSSVM